MQYFTLPHMSYWTIRSPDGSQIVTWSVRWTPLDCAGLDSSGVKNGSGVQRGVSSGFRWTVLDWSDKIVVESRERGGSGGFRRTVPNWSDKIVVESREGGPVDSARLSWTGLFRSEK